MSQRDQGCRSLCLLKKGPHKHSRGSESAFDQRIAEELDLHGAMACLGWDVCKLMMVYDEVFLLDRKALDEHCVCLKLRGKPIEPLFKVR